MHLSLKEEMSSKAALTDDHVNGGVVEVESDEVFICKRPQSHKV